MSVLTFFWMLLIGSLIVAETQQALALVPPALAPPAGGLPAANLPADLPADINEAQIFDLSKVKPIYPVDDSIFSKEMVTKYCPSSLTPTTDQGKVAGQLGASISQKWADTFLKDTLMEQPTFRHINNKVEEVAKKSITLSNSTPTTIEQKINFNFKAAERKAVAAYDGYFHSDATYEMANNDIVWVISKPLSKSTTLALSNTTPVGVFAPTSKLNLTYSF